LLEASDEFTLIEPSKRDMRAAGSYMDQDEVTMAHSVGSKYEHGSQAETQGARQLSAHQQ
jgi:hypothetical protein